MSGTRGGTTEHQRAAETPDVAFYTLSRCSGWPTPVERTPTTETREPLCPVGRVQNFRGYAAAARNLTSCRRSRSVVAPHTPASPCATAQSKHSPRTRHRLHTSRAGSALCPVDGKKSTSGVSLHSPSAIHGGRGGRASGKSPTCCISDRGTRGVAPHGGHGQRSPSKASRNVYGFGTFKCSDLTDQGERFRGLPPSPWLRGGRPPC